MTQSIITPEIAIQHGAEHQRAGRLPQAEACYRQALSLQPDHPDALHLLGVLAFQVGRPDAAFELIRQAIRANPSVPSYHCDYGHLLLTRGAADQAMLAFRESLRLQPELADAIAGMGNALQMKGEYDQAIVQYRKALSMRPNQPLMYNNLASALREKGELKESAKMLRQALTLRPDFPAASYNLGLVLHQMGQFEPAIAACQKAIDLQPKYPEAWNQIGMSLHQAGQLEKAVAAFEKAIAIKSDFAEAHSNLGKSLRALGENKRALESYRRAVSLRPEVAAIRFNFGTILLLNGEFKTGWEGFEARRESDEFRAGMQTFPQPIWDGSDPKGKRILLHTEHGFGDAVQFARYAPLLAQRGAVVIVRCQNELVQLFQGLGGVSKVIPRDQAPPDFDLHCPLLSLPRFFATTLNSIPRQIPYLKPDPKLVAHWHRRLPADPKLRKIGLVWAGRAEHANDKQRSLTQAHFAPISRAPNVWLCSLQKERDDSAWTRQLHDFADTAALIQNLDLVVTVDTAVAHLAGALGKRVWVLIPFAPDWRWMLEREDSPWYPTMRLFRQPTPGDWQSPIREMVEALQSTKMSGA